MIDYENLTNAEIKIKLLELENKFNSTKNKISALYNELNETNQEFIHGKEILNKRTRGVF